VEGFVSRRASDRQFFCCKAQCDLMNACSVTAPLSAVNLNMAQVELSLSLLVSADLREEIRVLRRLHGI